MTFITTWRTIGTGLCAAVLLAIAPVSAEDLPGDPAIGHELADQICAECHLIERDEVELYPDDPPSFQAIADDDMVTETSLRVFFQTPHRDMPNLMLHDEDIDHLMAYILNLRQGD